MSVNKSVDLSDKNHESMDFNQNDNSFVYNKELKKDSNINNSVRKSSVGEF